MNKFRLIYSIIASLLFSTVLTARTPPVLKYDSAVTKSLKPSLDLEQQVFSEVDLGLAKAVENHDSNAWNRFIRWLLGSVSDRTDYQDRLTLQRLLIGIFVIAGLSLAIWLFRKSELSSFLKGQAKSEEFNFSDVEEDISGIDFNQKTEQAKAQNDYRLAVRWLYLKQLFLLNEKNRIAWQPYKTNTDYTNELSGSAYKQAFKAISKVYEYVWYGEYRIDETTFNQLEIQFKQFEASVNV